MKNKNDIKWDYTVLCLLDSRDFRLCLHNAVNTSEDPNWSIWKFESGLNGNEVSFIASFKNDLTGRWATVRGRGLIERETTWTNYLYIKDIARINYEEETEDLLVTCTVALDENSVVDPKVQPE